MAAKCVRYQQGAQQGDNRHDIPIIPVATAPTDANTMVEALMEDEAEDIVWIVLVSQGIEHVFHPEVMQVASDGFSEQFRRASCGSGTSEICR